MSELRLKGEGVVVTHTTEEVTAEGIDGPVHLAVVRIAEGERGKPSTRVIARGDKPFAVGAPVRLQPKGDVLWAEPVL